MHPEISAFPRERFYSTTEGNQQLLRDASGVAGRSWGYTRHASRAEWADVQGKKENGNRNSREVRVALDELRAFAAWAALNPKPGGEAWTVALLTFYRGQEKLLRDELQRLTEDRGRSRNFKLPNVQITLCTVDRFQGHEADLVLLSFVKTGRPKSSVGFLNSPNRLNVALTRAMQGLFIVGDIDAYLREANAARRDARGRTPEGRPLMSLLARILEAYDLQISRQPLPFSRRHPNARS